MSRSERLMPLLGAALLSVAALCGCQQHSDAESDAAVTECSDLTGTQHTEASDQTDAESGTAAQYTSDLSSSAVTEPQMTVSSDDTRTDSVTADLTTASDTVTETAVTSESSELTDGSPVIAVETVTVRPGKKSIPVNVSLQNNPGYALCGVRLIYDAALKPVANNAEECYFETGAASDALLATCVYNAEIHAIAYAAFGIADTAEDGIIFTCYFDLPANAEAGASYPIRCELVDFAALSGQKYTAETVNGSITVSESAD